MNDAIYWNELSRALRPMTGAAAVLAGFCAAAMTLAGALSPAYAMGRVLNPPMACEVCQKPVATQTAPLSSAAVR